MRKRKVSFCASFVGTDGKEYDACCTANYWGGSPDVMYLSNGDPGYPGDPPEAEITSVTWDLGKNEPGDGKDLMPLVGDDAMKALERDALEAGAEDAYDYDGP